MSKNLVFGQTGGGGLFFIVLCISIFMFSAAVKEGTDSETGEIEKLAEGGYTRKIRRPYKSKNQSFVSTLWRYKRDYVIFMGE